MEPAPSAERTGQLRFVTATFRRLDCYVEYQGARFVAESNDCLWERGVQVCREILGGITTCSDELRA